MPMVRGKEPAGLAFVVLGGVILVVVLAAAPAGPGRTAGPMGARNPPWMGPWLWEVRGLDLAVQSLLVLAGVLGILHLLAPEGGQRGRKGGAPRLSRGAA